MNNIQDYTNTTIWNNMTCDNAIVTMSLGKRSFIDYTLPFMIKYSERTNSKLIVIDESNIQPIIDEFSILHDIQVGRGNNKCYLYKILVIIYYSKYFKKILWVDDTCFIKNNCVNLFDMISDDEHVMGYNEGSLKILGSWHNDKNLINKTTGFQINRTKYINTGVVLYSNKMKDFLTVENIIKYQDLIKSRYPHQCIMNFIIQYFKLKLKCIDKSYNCMFMNCSYKNGRNIQPSNIGDDFVLSDKNFIFHLTGFYKHRLEIAKYVSTVLSQSNESKPNTK